MISFNKETYTNIYYFYSDEELIGFLILNDHFYDKKVNRKYFCLHLLHKNYNASFYQKIFENKYPEKLICDNIFKIEDKSLKDGADFVYNFLVQAEKLKPFI